MKNRNKLYWKTFEESSKGKPMSSHGGIIWKEGETKRESNPKLCNRGFHASPTLLDAWSYVTPSFIAQVEASGKIDTESDNKKIAAESMKALRIWKWEKKDSLKFSIFCVKQSMKYIDKKKFPQVFEVCKKSILAVEAVAVNDTQETRDASSAACSAARSAASSAESAAWSAASSAESAACSAAWSAARSAACSAESAAWSAARSAACSAESAAWSAESAACSAAWSAAKKLQKKWLEKYVVKHCVRVK